MRIVGNRVIGHMGDVLAEKIYGQWDSKDPAVLDFIKANENKTTKKVRARTDEGQFIADDPSTPDVNEAWVVKTVKKVTKKK
jgi:hypothetical protein